MRGKTIKLYITGEDQKNLKTAELSQWTGKAFIGVRKHTKLIQKIEELSVPGIYILLSDKVNSLTQEIYIGEADEVNKRINKHFAQKDWWDIFVIFVSKDTNLTKAHVRYLEKSLFNIAEANITTLKIKNENKPSGSKLPISDEDDMEVFKDNILFITKNLGIIDFTKTEKEESETNDQSIFYLNLTTDRTDRNGNILQGKMKITNEGYRVLKGSYVEGKERKSFSSHTYYSLRKKIEKEGYLSESDFKEIYILNNEIDFSSASAAAAIIKNRATNGKKEWKLNNGTTLDDYENNLIS